MAIAQQTDDEQRRHWNGPGGRAWVEAQELLDQVLKPFEDLLVEAVSAKSPSQVLDVGCGTGTTTLAVARLLGTKGQCVGIDISGPMIAAARARAERESSRASFIQADAQLEVGTEIEFEITLPSEIIGSNQDVRVRCQGRVVQQANDRLGHSHGVGGGDQ